MSAYILIWSLYFYSSTWFAQVSSSVDGHKVDTSRWCAMPCITLKDQISFMDGIAGQSSGVSCCFVLYNLRKIRPLHSSPPHSTAWLIKKKKSSLMWHKRFYSVSVFIFACGCWVKTDRVKVVCRLIRCIERDGCAALQAESAVTHN